MRAMMQVIFFPVTVSHTPFVIFFNFIGGYGPGGFGPGTGSTGWF